MVFLFAGLTLADPEVRTYLENNPPTYRRVDRFYFALEEVYSEGDTNIELETEANFPTDNGNQLEYETLKEAVNLYIKLHPEKCKIVSCETVTADDFLF